MKINRYKLKDGVTKDDLLKLGFRPGGTYIKEDADIAWFRTLVDSISLNIAFPEDISKWNDFDYVIVLDDDFGQPYTPFYSHYEDDEDSECFDFLRKVITAYNKVMDSLGFLEKKDNVTYRFPHDFPERGFFRRKTGKTYPHFHPFKDGEEIFLSKQSKDPVETANGFAWYRSRKTGWLNLINISEIVPEI